MHNARPATLYGNIGLAVPGIEIYLPLSGQLALGMLCPSIRQEAQAALDRANQATALPEPIAAAKARLGQFAKTLANSGTLALVAPNVDHLNSLQVRTSARFGLAQQILKNWPHLKTGAKMTRK
jgi:hypothetical protein